MEAEQDGDADKADGQRGGVLADGEARNDVRGVAGLGSLGDFPDRRISSSRCSSS